MVSLSIGIIVLSLLCSFSNPVATGDLFSSDNDEPLDIKAILSISDNNSNNSFCSYCEGYFKECSYHCHSCNKCIEGMDHHCIWLNNCIGKTNYRYFIYLIASSCLFLMVASSLGWYLTSYMIADYEGLSNQIIKSYNINNGAPDSIIHITSGFIFILTIIATGGLLALLYLLLFHLFLTRQGLATWQLISSKYNKFPESKAKLALWERYLFFTFINTPTMDNEDEHELNSNLTSISIQ
ncbi:zf-DHHC-domain-containing protein [Neoconidiobolus thromboides FSU 785]|nr:zf-DHHC-domain-containing protein [Neoconidiobolus thromboides FSU 785]